MHSQDIFFELSLVLAVVAVVSILMRILRQPLILGYIISGILAGPLVFDLIHAKEAFEGFSQLGITLLLFIIGLGMNAGVIKSLGRVSLLTAAATLLCVGGTGLLVALALGFPLVAALIMGLSLFFSSTILILKVLSDKKELSRLHGQIAVGVILVDDVVATFALVIIATMTGHGSLNDIPLLVAKVLGLGLLLFLTGRYIIPRFAHVLAKSQELLFTFSIAWGFGVAALFGLSGFSIEVGALFAGVSLAGLPYATEMSTRLKPLRDFFVILFFVGLGETFVFNDAASIIFPAVLLSMIVLIGKPLVVLASLGALRYTRLTGFKAGVHLSQISEFSVVLIVLANQVGLVSDRVTSVMTLVALITIAVSSYLMKYDDTLYRKLRNFLGIFERKELHERKQKQGLYSAVLFGYHHGGHEFLELFRDTKQKYLIVDYNPEVIEHLESQGIRHAYGDATDTEFLEEINAGHVRFAASTIIDRRVNLQILSYLHRYSSDITYVCHARTYEDALELYEHGAAYVILPRFLGAEYITSHIKRYGMDKKAFAGFRARHIISIGRAAVENG